jgi:ubiquinone/menaquinone biosynthesis C-methylase UbiE
MLDVGIGGGRTTLHFASLVKECVGVDYSESMVRACEARFPNRPVSVSFHVADARSMDFLGDEVFDVVLFSFNGIDCMPHEDRLRTLREIRRVLGNGGLLFFSSHNLQYDKLLAFQRRAGPFGIMRSGVRYLLLRLLNVRHGRVTEREYAMIRDGAHRFRFKFYYIKPKAQITQLSDLGFTNIRVFALSDGTEIHDEALARTTDSYLYYLCTR